MASKFTKVNSLTDIRGPKQYHPQLLQQAVRLPGNADIHLGRYYDVHRLRPELRQPGCYPLPTGLIRVYLSNHHYPMRGANNNRAGFLPGAVLIISKWYLPNETQTRIAILYTSAASGGAFSGLLAFGIAKMNGLAGYEGWRWVSSPFFESISNNNNTLTR